MNARTRMLILAGLLPLCAQAAPPATGVVMVDCAHPAWPTPRDVSRHTGSDDFDSVADAWQQMIRQGRHACSNGVAQVRVVFAAAPDAPPAARARDDAALAKLSN
jgi:hypothetical protein